MVKAGDIFTADGFFYQVIKATAKTATVRPIQADFVGHADPYGWEKEYMPKPGIFIENDPILGARASREGKRLKIYDFSAAQDTPTLKVCGEYLYLWDGTPSIFDTYN